MRDYAFADDDRFFKATAVVLAAAVFAVIAYAVLRTYPTFVKKCESDIQFGTNTRRIAEALEKIARSK